jgi:8-oxo-dGTP pyrophosphatase MutT (NUDIX family)
MTARSRISHVAALDFTYTEKPWSFSLTRRVEIDAHFAERQRLNPALWNGRILIMQDMAVEAGTLRGVFALSDFASFRAWLDWGYPPAGAWDCFAAAAIVGADGGWITGEMGAHTANAGQVYFPCGTPDLSDMAGGRVDFDRSLARELKEETGLRVDEFDSEPGWTMVISGAVIALFKVLRSRDRADLLGGRIRAHLAREAQPELSAIRVIRAPADLTANMPPYVTDFLLQRWG